MTTYQICMLIALFIGACFMLYWIMNSRNDGWSGPFKAIVWLYFVGITMGWMLTTIIEDNKRVEESRKGPKTEQYRLISTDSVYIKIK